MKDTSKITTFDPPAKTRNPVVMVFGVITVSSFGFFLIVPYLALYLVFHFSLPAA